MKKIIFFCASVFGLVVWLVNARPVFAETIVVNTTAQKPGAVGDCTLGEAIDAANTDTAVDGCAAGAGADTITVPAGTYTLHEIDNHVSFIGNSGLPLVKGDVIISGAGADSTIIERSPNAPAFRILFINRNNVVVRGVTVRGGVTQGGFTISAGIGIEAYDVSLEAVTVSDNKGDGVTTLAGVSIKDSALKNNVGVGLRVSTAHAHPYNNTTVLDSQVTGNTDGGIWATQTALTIENTVVMNNYGDGIFARAVALTLENSTVASNTTLAIANEETSDFMGNPLPTQIRNSKILGNGLDGFFAAGKGQVTIEDSVIAYNGRDGVSIKGTYFDVYRSTLSNNRRHGLLMRGEGTRNIHNSTIADNRGRGILARRGQFAASVVNTTLRGNRGGLVARRGGVFKILNSTISGNFTPKGAGGIINNAKAPSSIEIENSILAKNSANFDPNCSGALSSLGHNIFGNVKKCNVTLAAGDQVVDPLLDYWMDDGAPAHGHYPLLSNSPAIDAVNEDACPATDQLGNARVGRCDVGAIEYVPAP